MLLFAGRYDEALAQFHRALELDPNYPLAHLDLARVYAARGEYDSALAELRRSPENVGSYGVGLFGYVLAKAGRRTEAIAEIRRLQSDSTRPYVVALPIAQIYGALGDRDHAFQWLDRAFADRNWSLYFCRVDPLLQDLRGDPRWAVFIQRMNFP
jgi:tetratricopeptide (TPR) repeat protein